MYGEHRITLFIALFCRLNSSANHRAVGWSLFRPDSTNELEIAVSYTRQPITERHVLFIFHASYSTVNTAPGIEKVEVECMTSTFSNPALFHSVYTCRPHSPTPHRSPLHPSAPPNHKPLAQT